MTNKELSAYVQKCWGMPSIYMWGGIMRTVTQNYINQLSSMYPNQYPSSRKKTLQSVIAKSYGCDCVGLIKSFWWGGVGSPNYDTKTDIAVGGFWERAQERGTIDTIPEIEGLVTYMDGHVGVYIGNGKVIECTLGKFGDGIVKTNLKGRGWTHWLKAPYITYEETPEQGYVLYTAKPGDCYWTIAEKEMGSGFKYVELCEFNGIDPKQTLHVGDVLKIPVNGNNADQTVIYTVKAGDCYWTIAEEQLGNPLRYPEICELNNVSPNTTLHVGDKLKIPAK